MGTYTSPRMATSALITIDTQNDFTLDGAPAKINGTAQIIPGMVRLLQAYRKRGLPVVHVVRLYLVDGSNVDLCRRESVEGGRLVVAPGSEGAELVQALKPRASVRLDSATLLSGGFQHIGENEYVMYKPRWGAFYNTGLEAFLRQRNIDTLVFCGCNYPNCPRTSIYEASERDFRIVLASDAISQLSLEGEQDMVNVGVNVLSTREVEIMLS